MKNLAISHSVYRTGLRIAYKYGKPIKKRKINSIGYNIWNLNVVRNGGVNYNEFRYWSSIRK